MQKFITLLLCGVRAASLWRAPTAATAGTSSSRGANWKMLCAGWHSDGLRTAKAPPHWGALLSGKKSPPTNKGLQTLVLRGKTP